MIDEKRILAVVPARGGSKAVPLKNIRPVKGVPLVAWVGKLVAQIPMIDRAVVSTDHQEIARIASESGLDTPFLRPLELSGDRVADWPVLMHALTKMEEIDGVIYDIIVMLQPTSPLRKAEHVIATIEKLVNEGYDVVWTLSETDSKYHPLKALVIMDGKFDYYDPKGVEVVARQDLSTLYHRNGVAYAITRECLVEQKSLKGKNAGALIIDGIHISIDTLRDFDFVEYIMSR